MAPDTQILILNWNGGADTVACVRSVLSFTDARITVLDNNSTDNSVPLMIAGLKDEGILVKDIRPGEKLTGIDGKLVLLRNSENIGFAGGNNLLMRQYLDNRDIKFFWLLNNDAVAAEGALAAMKRKMLGDQNNAFVGSVLLDYNDPQLIQCCGVHYYPYFAVSKMLLKNEHWTETTARLIPYDKMDFQHGASLLVKKSCIADVGLMDENYFLYFEEHDWQHRTTEKGYKNALAADALVYHKGSVSTSSSKYLFFYYYNRSAMIFARKHNPFFVRCCSVFLLLGVTLVRTKLNFKSLSWGLKGLFEGLRKKL
jgi:hypothetical protein